MPRLTLFRFILLSVTVFIILLTTWLILPSPPAPTGPTQAQYVTSILRSGASLATVHTNHYRFQFRTPPDTTLPNPNRHTTDTYNSVILDWQLILSSSINTIGDTHIYLQLGHASKPPPSGNLCTLDLVPLASQPPHFEASGCTLWARAGDPDTLTPSYFDPADATLLYAQASDTWQQVHLDVLVPERGIVQLWKYIPEWSSYTSADIADIDNDDRARYLVATFNVSDALQDEQPPSLDDVEISFQDARLPTSTYPIRRTLTKVLAPIYHSTRYLLTYILRPLLITIVIAIYAALIAIILFWTIVVLSYLYQGRPGSFSTFTKHFWLTAQVKRLLGFNARTRPRVWGVAGPLDPGEDDDGLGRSSRRAPRPLGNPWGFFSSKSPLDDLLFTFAATRWMVQPLRKKDDDDYDHDHDEDYEAKSFRLVPGSSSKGANRG